MKSVIKQRHSKKNIMKKISTNQLFRLSAQCFRLIIKTIKIIYRGIRFIISLIVFIIGAVICFLLLAGLYILLRKPVKTPGHMRPHIHQAPASRGSTKPNQNEKHYKAAEKHYPYNWEKGLWIPQNIKPQATIDSIQPSSIEKIK